MNRLDNVSKEKSCLDLQWGYYTRPRQGSNDCVGTLEADHLQNGLVLLMLNIAMWLILKTIAKIQSHENACE